MELNKLETTFFQGILNAKLDVPVHATLKYEGIAFKIIVVPDIAPEGYFRLKYFNAPPYKPEPQVGNDGTPYTSLTMREAFGSHPLLERAWQERATVELQLHPSQLPIQPKPNPMLKAKVLYADVGHKGELVLDDNQVMLRTSPLRKAEFSISDFCDFVTAGTQMASIAGVMETHGETLQSIGSELADGARLTLSPAPRRVILNTDDGWEITLTKDEKDMHGAMNHTGVVEKSGGDEFEIDDLNDVIEGLRYFFAFVMVKYCFPSVIVGYDAIGGITWGKAGKFQSERRQPVNWFQHAGDVPSGSVLERFFPRFWRKWKAHRDELIAVIDCYVSSEAMRQSGILQDSVAKSCAGLETLASLVRGQTVFGDAKDAIDKILRCYKIPYRQLDNSKNPVTHKLCADLSIADNNGSGLLVDARNYVIHPLDKNNTVVKLGHLQYVDGDMVRYAHLHNLSQFYLEYMLLRFCGHNVVSYRPLRED